VFETSENPVLGKFLEDALLTALSAMPAGALLDNPKIKLFTGGPSPITRNSVIGDFTEATFGGYASAVADTIGVPINLPSGVGRGIPTATGNFVCTGAPFEVILGYWIEDFTSHFIMGETFAAPIAIASAGDFISLTVVYPLADTVPVS